MDVEETEVTVEDEESEDDARNAQSEPNSSEDEYSEDVARLGISREEVEANQLKMGEEVMEEKPSLNILELREKYPEAFTSESETCLSVLLEDLQLPFKLSDYVPGTSGSKEAGRCTPSFRRQVNQRLRLW